VKHDSPVRANGIVVQRYGETKSEFTGLSEIAAVELTESYVALGSA